jgi:nucleotide-binding universal stress UspA family protein
MIEQILVAHDGSDSARKAFHFAVELTARLGARLRMICVEEDIPRHAEAIDELREEKDRADSVQHAAAGTRSMVNSRLETHQNELERKLIEAFEREFPKWTKSLASMLSLFEDWLATALRDELAALSIREGGSFLAPLQKVRKQAFRVLQQFRDRLSDGVMRAFGAPLRTTETEIDVIAPDVPDIRVGRVFDRNWELLSPVLAVWMAKAAVHRYFARTIPYVVYQNLSRISSQWEESLNGALWGIEKEGSRRLDESIDTVVRIVESGNNELAPQLRADLERLEKMRKSLAPEAGSRSDPNWRLLPVAGFLGGYATFSSFEWETYTAVRAGDLRTGMLNVVSSVMLGYVAVWPGSMLASR